MPQKLPDVVVQLFIESSRELAANKPNSSIVLFGEELRSLGFEFQAYVQVKQFMPKYYKIILPLAIKYYNSTSNDGERNYFISLMRYRVCREVVPMLLNSYYEGGESNNRGMIAECINAIGDKRYCEEYLRIASDEAYGGSRGMFVMLLGRFKYEAAIPVIIDLLDVEDLRSYAISALGDFKDPRFIPYLTRFVDSPNAYWRKYAKSAIKRCERGKSSHS